MKPFFTYYGGKYRAAPRYPSPLFRSIVEPFAGSAGYSVRYNAESVLLVDKDPRVTGTWKYLIGSTPRELRSLPDLQAGQTVDDLKVSEEAKLLIGWWLGKGRARPGKSPSSWMRSGIRPASMWGPEVRERLAAQAPQVRHWIVREGSYEDIWTGLEATWFVDPPYQHSGGKEYRHSNVDYENLSDWCQSLSGQVIVCEGPGASWLPFGHAFNAKGTEGPLRTGVSTELVWYGGTSGNREAA